MTFEIVRAVSGIGGPGLDTLTNDWMYQAIELLAIGICFARVIQRPEQRLAWTLMTAALSFWSAGDLLWSVWLDHVSHPPAPSVADVLYLLTYPAMYGSLMILMRSRIRDAVAAQWLDGGVASLAVGSVAAALVLANVLASTTGRFAADAVNIAYPVMDFILLMFVVMAWALTGRRQGRDWVALGGGVTLMALADILYADQSSGGIYVSSGVDNVLYLASFCVLACAAWLPSDYRVAGRAATRDTMGLTLATAAIALGLLVVAAFTAVSPWAVGLAAGALVLTGVRSALTYHEYFQMLHSTRLQAVTDPLTGLANRRQLIFDLEDLFRNRGRPATLAFFDLNGFKRYNDSYGHGAGDALLTRLGSALSGLTSGGGSAYRLGGDEFCVLLDGHHSPHDQLLAGARSALSERGAGFAVTTSLGVALIPDEARSADEALRLADERMYVDKGRTQRSPVRDVLMQLLTEHTPGLLDHASGVTRITAGVSAQFELDAEGLDETLRAAELHDIGKLAIPDAILDKSGPLDETEWAFMRQHPVIGQRILDAAPALAPVGVIVRATHERWDGAGYPDGVAGQNIPLGARIISVCDAYDAMISDRCHQPARSHDEALAELRRHAGTQFDPAVVEAVERYFGGIASSDESAGVAAAISSRTPE